jgi:hypothetical protein
MIPTVRYHYHTPTSQYNIRHLPTYQRWTMMRTMATCINCPWLPETEVLRHPYLAGHRVLDTPQCCRELLSPSLSAHTTVEGVVGQTIGTTLMKMWQEKRSTLDLCSLSFGLLFVRVLSL